MFHNNRGPLYRVPMAQPVVLSNGAELCTPDGFPVPSSALGNISALASEVAVDPAITGAFVAGTTADGVKAIVAMLKAAYTSLTPKVATTLYITTDTGGIFLGSTTIVAGS